MDMIHLLPKVNKVWRFLLTTHDGG